MDAFIICNGAIAHHIFNSSCSLFIGKLNEPETRNRTSDTYNCPIGNIREDYRNYRTFPGKRCETFRPLSITDFTIKQCILLEDVLI